jgi:hypothetical protein
VAEPLSDDTGDYHRIEYGRCRDEDQPQGEALGR